MQSSELQSGKLQAKMAGVVTKKNGEEEIMFENGFDPESVLGTSTIAGEESTTGTPLNSNYDRLENLTGGYMEYLDEDDDFKLLDINRPNIKAQEYLENININNGASLGLAKVYSTMQASTAYTAFRGEMLLSWAQFYVDQKWLERRFMDWLAIKAINWGIKKGHIDTPPTGWESKNSFAWPTMPIVDPLKLEMSIAKALKNGRTDFKKILGPQWEEILKGYAEQIKTIRELEIPLEVLESKSGGLTPTTAPAADAKALDKIKAWIKGKL
jgi:capsid protein